MPSVDLDGVREAAVLHPQYKEQHSTSTTERANRMHVSKGEELGLRGSDQTFLAEALGEDLLRLALIRLISIP